MIRLHLAQIRFVPAYFDEDGNWLENPTGFDTRSYSLRVLRQYARVAELLERFQRDYLAHIKNKVLGILEWSAARGANIVAFPEYSIPPGIIWDMKEFCERNHLLIVAGSHRASDDYSDLYQELKIPRSDVQHGTAVVPLLLPDGRVSILATKQSKSKWEPDLHVVSSVPRLHEVSAFGPPFVIAALPCSDAIEPRFLGKLWDVPERSVHLIICPASSPVDDHFRRSGEFASAKSSAFCFINNAEFGGTLINIHDSWRDFLTGPSFESALTKGMLPVGTETILEVDVDPSRFAQIVGRVDGAPKCSNPVPHPIVYHGETSWTFQYQDQARKIREFVQADQKNAALVLVDKLNAEAWDLPLITREKLRRLRHNILRYEAPTTENVDAAIGLVVLDRENTTEMWGRNLAASLGVVSQLISDPRTSRAEGDRIFNVLKKLNERRERVPALEASQSRDREGNSRSGPSSNGQSVFATSQLDLAERFENRGLERTLFEAFLGRPEARVVVATGPIGAGKSAFFDNAFRRFMSDWNVVPIRVPHGATTGRLVADLAYQVGMTMDIDAINIANGVTFRDAVKTLGRAVFSIPKRAFIVDDLEGIFITRNPVDLEKVNTLIHEFADPASFVGGRVVFVSSRPLPLGATVPESLERIHFRPLEETYIARIIQREMRQKGFVATERPVPVTPQILELVAGNPLCARLAVEAFGADELDISKQEDQKHVSRIAEHVAHRFLSLTDFQQEDEIILKKLSVFRLPIQVNVLARIDGTYLPEGLLGKLSFRSIVDFDGKTVSMQEVIRRFFFDRLSRTADIVKYHRLASTYYKRLITSHYKSRRDPSVIGELVYHMSMAGDLERATDLVMIVSEVKAAARELYKLGGRTQHYGAAEIRANDNNYHKALRLYIILKGIVPDDLQVLAYIGRCHARLQDWAQSSKAFEEALQAASEISEDNGWIYRDWGHILLR